MAVPGDGYVRPALGRAGGRSARASGGGRAAETEFILLLGMRRPRLLIPAAPRAGAAAVRGYGQPGSRTARLGARALSLALASGLGGAVLRSRIRVHAPPGTEHHRVVSAGQHSAATS